MAHQRIEAPPPLLRSVIVQPYWPTVLFDPRRIPMQRTTFDYMTLEERRADLFALADLIERRGSG
jgi:hypothetical protein